MAFAGRLPDMKSLLLFPAIVLLFMNCVWIGLVFGVLCARFRDIIPIVTNIVQVAFFITPIMFEPKLLKGYDWIAVINPFYHLASNWIETLGLSENN